MTEKLRPCPFCGSDSLYIPENPVFDYYVRCNNCGSRSDSFFTNAESAIKAWNMRANND